MTKEVRLHEVANVRDWLLYGKQGWSSMSLMWVTGRHLGICKEDLDAVCIKFRERTPGARPDHPCDVNDFGLCVRLLKAAPELRPFLPKLGIQSEYWEVLVNHWDELERLWESGEKVRVRIGRAHVERTACTVRIQELLSGVVPL